MPQKIAFLKIRDFSFINPNLIAQFKRVFPEYSLEVFDFKDWLKYNPHLYLLAMAAVYKEYGREILAGQKKPNPHLFVTRWIGKRIKKLVQQRFNPRDYAFTFQTQTNFDASVAGMPHFIYTDHTLRANWRYKLFDPSKIQYSAEWRSAIEPEIYRNASKIFFASNFARTSAIEDYQYPAEKAECVYTGINVKIDPPTNKAYTAKRILFVGVEWERKGGPEVAEAFKRIQAQHPDATLTIVGCSPELDLPNCQVIGRVPREQVVQYFREATIFCMPSRIEPAGIAFTEAAMYKLPIISANSGGLPDRVLHGQTGYLIEPGDVDSLTKYLSDLLDHPERCREFGEAGYQLAHREFTWDRVGDRIRAAILSTIQPTQRMA